MSWQNQVGQMLDNQPVSPYPGQQAAQPFSSIPTYPNVEQFQQQSAPQIPAGATTAAQAAGLGTLTKTFRKSAGGKLPGTGGLNLGLTIGGVSIVGAALVVLFVVPFPFNVVSAAITVLTILPFLPMILKFAKIFNGGNSGNALQVWSGQDGLVYAQNGQMNAVHWSDIRQVWRKIGLVNGVMTVIGYRVQPANAPQFEFSLLGGPYAGLLGSFGGSSTMSFSSGAGELSNYGGFTQISGAVDLSAYAGLGDLLEEQMLKCLLPRALEMYHSGGTLSFGRFMVRQQGLSDGSRELAWNEIANIQILVPAVQITKKPASMVWFNLSAADTPNMALLAAVLNTIQSK